VLTLEEATPQDFGQCHVDYCARCSTVLFLMEQATFRRAYCYTYIRWDLCYHFQNDHDANTEFKNVQCVLCCSSSFPE
jgi:hypothetical protein